MKNLKALYKFAYKKPQLRLPDLHFICQIEEEKTNYFFYQLEANNYISLDVLMKLYRSQILRLSIGQQMLLIKKIYDKIVSIYLNNQEKLSGQQIGKLTVENIWIYTESGFSGELEPQNKWEIIFLNYHDEEKVGFEQNLSFFSQIQDNIIKNCKETEYKIRARDDNKLETRQIIDVLDDLFYDFQQTLYYRIDQIDKFISENLHQELQETDYEYNNPYTDYIKQNFQKVVNYLNVVFNLNQCQSEFEQHTVLLKWQQCLYDQMVETTWNRQGYQETMELLKLVNEKICNIKNLSEERKKLLEDQIFEQMLQYEFFNFNTLTVRLAKVLDVKKNILKLHNEANEEKKLKDQKKGEVFQKYSEEKEKSWRQFDSNEKEKLRVNNGELIENYFKNNCQNKWGIYKRFYFTINLYKQWKDLLLKNICPDLTINQNLEKDLDLWFEDLLKKNYIGEQNEQKFKKYD